ncbi:MAG: hypothetical protein M1834_004274 [Cirrosporium novae-zelandiae]|nr:MAG: hypothetical protein M1834_004274 [Cirrosporium novae-zelandiae]
MPANFRDAIIITRKLGLRYLWIDSLCIIQDSRSDWEQQSAVMGSIYHSSALTIAAASAKNSEGETSWGCSDKGTLAVRAWALQERLLSHRILSYGKRQLYWHCQYIHHSGDGDREPLPDYLYSELLNFSSPAHEIHHLSPEHRNNKIYKAWYATLRNYCDERQLTVATDKLPALAGLAAEFHKLLDDVYLAGLWANDLHRGLLWRADGALASSSKKPRAPSWSWVKLDGVTIFPESDDHSYRELEAEILAHEVKLAGENPYGEVSWGKLTIRGLTYSPWDGVENITDEKKDMDPQSLPPSSIENINANLNLNQDQLSRKENPKQQQQQTNAQFYTLLLISWIRAESGQENSADPIALILKKVNNQSQSIVYERVGILMIREESPLAAGECGAWTRQTVVVC